MAGFCRLFFFSLGIIIQMILSFKNIDNHFSINYINKT